MIKLFLPNEQVRSIFDIDLAALKKKGIRGIITDLDNTLVEWNRPNATPELEEWFKMVKKNGIQVTIVSNNNEDRVKSFADPLNIPFIHKARKPMGRAYRKALKIMNVKKEETVVIGDQLLTDVLGGNLSGFYTILVVPVAQTDGFWTRINRLIERRIMNVCKKKGLIQWEDKR